MITLVLVFDTQLKSALLHFENRKKEKREDGERMRVEGRKDKRMEGKKKGENKTRREERKRGEEGIKQRKNEEWGMNKLA